MDPPEPGPEPEPTPPEVVVSKGAYKHVFIIGVDGGGAYFRETNTPRCDEIFMHQATAYQSMMALPTMSAQGWASILHGVLPKFHGCTNDIIAANPYPKNSRYPSIFRVVREAMPDAELASFDSLTLNLGQDGTGKLSYKLPAQMDEFIMTRDVLTESDVASLKTYYQPR